MAKAILYLLAYISIALFPAILVVVQAPTPGGNFLYEFGRNIALAIFSILTLQPVLAARFSWIDRSVGTPSCLRFHKAMGFVALIGALLHPVSLAIGGAGLKLLKSWDVPWFVVIGKLTLILLTIHVVLALLRLTLKMSYQKWRNGHAIASPVILTGAFVHSWFGGADLSILELRACWILLMMMAVAAIFHKRIKVTAGSSTMKGRQRRGDDL